MTEAHRMEWLSHIWRRKAGIAVATLIMTGTAWGTLSVMPRLYTAQAEILIDVGNPTNERAVLASRGMALRVIDDLRLMDDPAFNRHLPAAQAEGDAAYKGLAVHKSADVAMPSGVMDRTRGAAAERFLSRLHVAHSEKAAVVSVAYADANPVRAALVANRLAMLYIAERQEEAAAAIALPVIVPAAGSAVTAWTPRLPPPPPADNSQADRRHHAELQEKLARLLTRYGEKHPEIRALRAALAESKKNLAAPLPPPPPSTPVAATEEPAIAAPAAAIPAPPAGARLISPATIPDTPSWPPLRQFVVTIGLLTLLFTALMAVIAGRMRQGFRTAQGLEDHTGLPCYAMLPLVAHDNPATPLADLTLLQEGAQAAESVRSLRAMTALRVPAEGERPRVIAMTSSYQGEGKSTTCAWLARAAAQAGEKTIIIDCDMRRPAQHKIFAATRGKTLTDYLEDQAKIEDIIQTTDSGGVHIIYASASPGRALDLLSSDRFARLIAALRKIYDVVLLDAPAAMAVTDPLVLARHADLTIYNVVWNDTPRDVIESGLRTVRAAARGPIALVLNKVDLKAQAAYGYGDVRYEYMPEAA